MNDIVDFEAVQRRQQEEEAAAKRADEVREQLRIDAEKRRAKERHAANMRTLADDHELLEGNVNAFLKDVGISIAKAADDPSHVPHVRNVIRDAHLKVDELRAWVKRNL